eukprot:TRINITY_DN16674_c0_g1_i1.p2 TRINITY_DN16674_c0_g1~~TRINITY_DN16674_c0_g1_i1.p2  ORF type:complete len:277 (+),score=44.76 TRINITY_DN16674_c0_g1_i1:90-920(+)
MLRKKKKIALAQQGWMVFAGIRKHEDAIKLIMENDKIIPIRLDVTDPETIQEAYQTVANNLFPAKNGLTALINNAGIIVTGPTEFIPTEKWVQQMDVNLYGAVRMIQAFLPLLRGGDTPGRIINIGSMAGTIALPTFGPYACSKFAMEGLCDSLRLELNHMGIHVVLIKPGTVKTEIFENTLKLAKDVEENYPPQADHLYGIVLRKMYDASVKAMENGCDVQDVVKVIQTALDAFKPQARYLVGKQNAVSLIKHYCTDATWDQMSLKALGLAITPN